MILPQTYAVTLLLTILSLLCLGIWVSSLKFAGKWRFELFYFDFVFGLLGNGVDFAFTLGNLGYDGFDFLDDLQHAGKRQWVFGFAAGMIFNLANLLLVAAVSVAGNRAGVSSRYGDRADRRDGAKLRRLQIGQRGDDPGRAGLVLVSALVNVIGHRLLVVERP